MARRRELGGAATDINTIRACREPRNFSDSMGEGLAGK